ncbi:ABC transporter permease [uncultured Thiodictyon sp.]|uniref:MlaE family ABC transporter permease n=1 Tax=uncultured Thiodictyon sp. TaxID=1846217 RepID=UPI0025D4F7E8|nr:ABC transporter permease [uncultured Thiodictyon sp.]
MSNPHPIAAAAQPERPFTGPVGWIEGLGLAAVTLLNCLSLYLRILAGRARLDVPAFAAALRQSGLSILPAITLVALALGAILGHQTGSLLQRFELPQLVLLSITYAVVMELVPILVGILVAGRAGVNLAVRQATLSVSGEVDGLLAMGIDPIEYTLGPTLLAMMVMSFAFAVWASLMTFIATFLWLSMVAAVPPALFLDAFTTVIKPADLLEAIGKPMLFALLIALIATVNGTAAGRDPQGIGAAATRTMVGAVAAILVADLAVILLTRP